MKDLWAKALEAAEDAHLLLRNDRLVGATSRAYYAAFTAARVLICERLGVEPRDIRRHSTVLRIFSEHFVKPGLVSREIGRRFAMLSEERAEADYGVALPEPIRTQAALAFMDAFLKVVCGLRPESDER